MYSFAHPEAFVSDEVWTLVFAGQEIRAAIAALEDVGGALVRLIDDSDWECEGVRSLTELLGSLRDRSAFAVGELTVREWEIEAVVLP